jgi:TIGR03009 family protein
MATCVSCDADLAALIGHGAACVKVGRRSKKPLGMAWQNTASTSPEVVAAWLESGYNVGILLGHGRLIDVEFDDAAGKRLAFTEATGELKYAAPDKGLFRVKEVKQWNPETRRLETRGSEAGEHWVCNGESIYEFRHTERQLRETKLPPDMRGMAISDGPLPFVFGAKAETLKKRYWMRIVTPPDVRNQIWLEALPKHQADAANFSKVELILQARELMPFAIQIFKPAGQDRDVYQFDPNTNLIDKGLDMIRDFAKPMTPFGYKYVLEDLQAAAPGQPRPR